MRKEIGTIFTSEQTEMHKLFIANAKLIQIVSVALARNPNGKSISFMDGSGHTILTVDRKLLNTFRLANWGLYNELAHPPNEISADRDRLIPEQEENRIAANLIKLELEKIKKPDAPFNYQEIFIP